MTAPDVVFDIPYRRFTQQVTISGTSPSNWLILQHIYIDTLAHMDYAVRGSCECLLHNCLRFTSY